MNAIGSATSGLYASMARFNASASNTANVDSIGATSGTPAAYTPISVVQETGADGTGVSTSVVTTNPATYEAYDPGSYVADTQGMIARPNVDLVQEGINQLGAKRAYEANVSTLRAANETERTALNLLA